MNKNYQDILDMKVKSYKAYIIYIMIIVISVCLSFKYSITDVYKTLVVSRTDYLYVNVSYIDSFIFIENKTLYINDKSYDYEVISISDPYQNGSDIYQEIALETKHKFFDNEINEISIYYNEDKIINKIKEIILKE